MLPILFAPMQGITDAKFRRQHHTTVGGVAEYYTPFARIERGRIRDKERKDLLPERNRGVPTVPQVIARDRDEFALLCDAVQRLGWDRIDLNMGCPFPMQAHSGRGSGLLPHPDRVAAIVEEMTRRPDVYFSVKMRLGWDNPQSCFDLLPILNQAPLVLVTMHPRLGIQQYKGSVDLQAFEQFYHLCTRPLCYNGDITSIQHIRQLESRFPRLSAVMIGRALLERNDIISKYQM